MTPEELTAALCALKPFDGVPTDNTWRRHRYELRKHALNDDPTKFTQWSTIVATMFVGEAPYIREEWDALGNSQFADRFVNAIMEYETGSPARLSYAPLTSGNMVHAAYHLLQWMNDSGKDVKDLHTIVEFGGGYGAMCTVVRRMGFNGKYVLYDNLDFSLLQQYYLSNVNINAAFSVVDDLERFALPPTNTDLLIACYSLSEVSEQLRHAFFDTVSARHCLLAYQSEYDDIKDMLAYMRHFAGNRVDKYKFNFMPNIPLRAYGHEYAFATKLD